MIGLFGADAARHFEAVHLRHADVEQDGIRMKRLQDAQRLSAAVGHLHNRAQRAEQRGDCIGRIAIVVDDENALIGKCGRSVSRLVFARRPCCQCW